MKKDLVKILITAVICPLLVFDFLFIFTQMKAWKITTGAIMVPIVAIPLSFVKAGVVLLLLALAGWALSFSRNYVYQGLEERPAWRDVRYWAVIVIGLEIIPYLFF